MNADQLKDVRGRVEALRRYLWHRCQAWIYKRRRSQIPGSGFWDNPKQAEQILKGIKVKKIWTDVFAALQAQFDDLVVLWELEADEQEIEAQYQKLLKETEELEFKNMLSGEEDQLSAIININSGAGGTESQDWASMLMRMYLMWAEKHGYKVSELDYQEGDGAGIKSCSLEITGDFAYGYLKGENGVHRLVRISPFDSNARRHTSFASVYCYPVVDESIEIEIKDADIEIQTSRSGGAGGQT